MVKQALTVGGGAARNQEVPLTLSLTKGSSRQATLRQAQGERV